MTNTIFRMSILLVLSFNSLADSPIPENERLEARTMVKSLASQLQGTLKPAMKNGGAIEAIEVCYNLAGPLTDKVSAESDWLVSRTALKVRNEANHADAWERQVLEKFEQRKAAGEDIKTMEYSEWIVRDDRSVYRYMKAIPTGELCLKCHGSNLDSAVLTSLKKSYPNDRAIGFNNGDIRGAFSLKKSVN
jgi:hypothetical protein